MAPLGFILSIVGFVLGMIQMGLTYHFQMYYTTDGLCTANPTLDRCTDWADIKTAEYVADRAFASGTSQITTILILSTLASWTLFALYFANVMKKVGKLGAGLDDSVLVAVAKVGCWAFAWPCFILTCSNLSWDSEFSTETGSIANAYLAFNVLSWIFFVVYDLLNGMGKSKSGTVSP